MIAYPAKARTGSDGRLTLTVPTSIPNTDVDVLVVVDLQPSASPDLADEWPPGFLDKYFGALAGQGFERHSQGELQERLPLE